MRRAEHLVLDDALLHRLGKIEQLEMDGSPAADSAPGAVHILRALHREGLCGSRSAIVIGDHHVTVADWHRGNTCSGELAVDGPSPRLKSDGHLLAAYIRAEQWARNAPLRNPLASALHRAMHDIAMQRGYPPGAFRVSVTSLSLTDEQ